MYAMEGMVVVQTNSLQLLFFMILEKVFVVQFWKRASLYGGECIGVNDDIFAIPLAVVC